MTAPRQVLPGTTYLVTRRCAQRQFLLRPCRSTNQIFSYVLALAAARFGVAIHAFCVMSNHFHLILTDPHARLPAFEQYLDSLVARAINASLGRWEAFWAPSSYSAVALTGPEDIVDKASYVLANPVAAGLVPTASLWPGLWSAPRSIGAAPMWARRPAAFFDAKGYLPEEVPLYLEAPPGFATAADFRTALEGAVARREAAVRARSGSFLGAAKVLAQRFTDRPASRSEHRALKPRVAARDTWKRIEALGRLRAFLTAYRDAWERRCAGAVEVLFPAGTYLLRVQHGVPCAAAG